ncbi:MAG: phosphomannomutase/phosphoglucomutase [Nitrospirota bacterium]
MIESNIFREYDIRGVIGKDLTIEAAEDIGMAFGTYLKKRGLHNISLARDGRLSSRDIHDSVIRGLLSTGVNITDLGVCPTPLLYFSLFQLEVEGGLMITGSHNPSDYNGFKLCVGKDTLYGEEIQELRRIIERNDFETGKGELTRLEIIPSYINCLKENFNGINISNIKVVTDSGNGTAGMVAPQILSEMGCEVIELFSKVDGNFPNHHPDPTIPDNLKSLIAKVSEEGADFGIGYDGDADRIGVVDENGEVLWGDKLLIIFARDILEKRPSSTFISEVKSSQVLYDDIEKRGGKAIMWKTGHSLIKSKIKETGAVLAGEMSGHIFFADRYFGYDDAIYASCRLVEILNKFKSKDANFKGLSRLLDDIPETYSTPEIRIESPDDKKFKIVEKIKERFSKEYKVIDVDGARILFEDGWGLVRASNTQPVLVLRFEANSKERLNEIREYVERELKKIEV